MHEVITISIIYVHRHPNFQRSTDVGVRTYAIREKGTE